MERVLRAIYRRYRTEFKKIESELIKEHWVNNCDFAVSIDGHDYYRFKSSADLPLMRMERIQVCLMELDARLSKSELNHLMSIIELNLQSAINAMNQKGKLDSLQKAIWAVEEVKARQSDLMLHPIIMSELAALTLIRADENPTEVNESIHTAKVESFKVALSSHDFFLQSGLSLYFPNSAELQNKYRTNWELSLQYVQAAAKRLELIHSEAQLLNG